MWGDGNKYINKKAISSMTFRCGWVVDYLGTYAASTSPYSSVLDSKRSMLSMFRMEGFCLQGCLLMRHVRKEGWMRDLGF